MSVSEVPSITSSREQGRNRNSSSSIPSHRRSVLFHKASVTLLFSLEFTALPVKRKAKEPTQKPRVLYRKEWDSVLASTEWKTLGKLHLFLAMELITSNDS